MTRKTTGIILAGGHGSRMGNVEKGLLKYEGKEIISYVLEQLEAAVSEILIISNSPGIYDFLGFPVFPDIIPNCGPLGGIYTGLFHSNSLINFAVSCDMPNIRSEAINYLIENSAGYQAAVFKTPGGIEPLFTVFSSNCLGLMENELREGHYSVRHFLKKLNVYYVDYSNNLPFYVRD
ncbi:MAG: molybdenum cofactor guanylyltransferase, partial [Fidelibacterota bacterium]